MTTPVTGRSIPTPSKHRWIRIVSVSVLLLSLLVLLFVALVVNVNIRTSHPFFRLFTCVLEIIGATSAAIEVGGVVGRFKNALEKRFSKNCRLLIQVTVGFTVFIVVMFMSPRQQMDKVADAFFDAQFANCRSATRAEPPDPDAEGRCLALIERYPNRPEPLELLGHFIHNKSPFNTTSLTKAREYLQRAFDLYDIKPDQPTNTLSESLSGSHLSTLRDVVYGAAVTTANADLLAFDIKREKETREAAMRSLKQARQYLTFAEELGRIGEGTDYRIRVVAALGVVDIYAAYLRDELNDKVLKSAEQTFRKAIAIDLNDAPFQLYNIFVVTAHRAYDFSDPAALPVAKDALSKFFRALPGILDNSKSDSKIIRWLCQITDNKRDDPFVITRPIGGKAIAGKSMARFFTEHPSFKSELQEIIWPQSCSPHSAQ